MFQPFSMDFTVDGMGFSKGVGVLTDMYTRSIWRNANVNLDSGTAEMVPDHLVGEKGWK